MLQETRPFVAIFVIVFLCVLLSTAFGNWCANSVEIPLTKKQRAAIIANISSSTWLGNIPSLDTRKTNAFAENVFHANQALTVPTAIVAVSDKPKWKFSSYVDVGGTTHVIDKFPQLSLERLQKAPLMDMKTAVAVLPEQVVAAGVSLFEKLPNGEFRFRVKCSQPNTGHSDFPWSCFKCPCSSNLVTQRSLYNASSKECDCGAYKHAELNDRRSPCVPEDSLEFYDKKREIAQMRVPCWNGEGSVLDAYPCSTIGPQTHKMSSVRIRVRFVPYNPHFHMVPEARTDLSAPDEYTPFDILYT